MAIGHALTVEVADALSSAVVLDILCCRWEVVYSRLTAERVVAPRRPNPSGREIGRCYLRPAITKGQERKRKRFKYGLDVDVQ